MTNNDPVAVTVEQVDRDLYAHLLTDFGGTEWEADDARSGEDDDDASLIRIAEFRLASLAPVVEERDALKDEVKRLRALVNEALIKQENDRTMWVPEWQIWAVDARTAIQEKNSMTAVDDIAAERRRQITAEGYDPAHDDFHSQGELGLAAALYALPYEAMLDGQRFMTQNDFIRLEMLLEIGFGWNLKREPDRRRRLVKAGALIIAEIERMDRAAALQEINHADNA